MAGRPTTEQAQGKQQLAYTVDYNVPRSGIGWTAMPRGMELLRDMEIMANQDETVGAMLWCIASTISQVVWKHQPQKDGADSKDEDAIADAAFADSLMLDMEFSMADYVEETVSTMLWAGFAPNEIVLKQRDGKNSRFSDKLYGVSRLALIDPLSVLRWIYKDESKRDLIGIEQQATTGYAKIPLWKVLHFRTTPTLNHPAGKPMMMNAWRAWKLKEKIQDSEAIGIERELCGLPMMKMPKADLKAANERDSAGAFTPDALAAQARIQSAIKAVQNLRFNESGGIVLPSDTFFDETEGDRTPQYDFKIVTSAGQRSIDSRTAARDYDRAIARVAMMQFLHLGDRSTGSFSLSDDQSNMAVRSLMTLALKIAAEWNRKLLPMVWAANGKSPATLPKLKPSEINKDGLAQLGAFLSGLGKATGLWDSDPDLREAIVKLMNLPYNRDAQDAAAKTARETAELGAQPPPAPVVAPGGAANSNSRPRPKAAAEPDEDDEDDEETPGA